MHIYRSRCLRSAQLYVAQQRSEAPCGAVRCGAVPCPSFCGAVSCGAVRSFEHTTVAVPRMIKVPALCTCCVLVFCFLQLIVLSRSPCFRPPANVTRTAVQNVTSTSTQHSAGQLALHKHLLALLSIRYSHQIIKGLFFLPHLFTCFSY